MAKNEKTSPKVAAKASKLLSAKDTPKRVKSVAASALTQTLDKPKKKAPGSSTATKSNTGKVKRPKE